jgi:hypothetical protein
MNTEELVSYSKFGGKAAISGAVIMLIGAAFWGSTGTDLWQALRDGAMNSYLEAAGEVKTQLTANITFWIIGVITMGIAGKVMVDLTGKKGLATAALICTFTAVPLAVISFIAMLSLVIQIAPDTSETSLAIANVVGWIGARADDLATALIVGIMPMLISKAGYGIWVPKWLLIWGYIAGLFGLISIAAIYIPSLFDLGFLIVPSGIGWMIAAGIVLLRK